MSRHLEQLLREHRAPDEQAAEDRALRLVREAYAERRPTLRARRRRSVALAAAAAAAVLLAALTPPGQAVAEWVRDTVRPGRDDARPALVSLPAAGRILVTSERGIWVVDADGSKRLLAGYRDAAWSPQGLFIAATRGRELIALEPGGRPRWSLARTGAVATPRWSPDGFRIAYRSGRTLRVVAGDGTGDALLSRSVAPVAPAWRPGNGHQLAYVDAHGRIAIVQTDTRQRRRAAAGARATELAWSTDGRRLLAIAPGALRLFDARGRLLETIAAAPGTRIDTAAFRPSGLAVALLSHERATDRSRLDLVRLGAAAARRQPLLAGAGRFGDLAWSPDGRWLLAGWRDADQWIFIRTGAAGAASRERIRAVGNISRQFDPGATTPSRFPGVAGWGQ